MALVSHSEVDRMERTASKESKAIRYYEDVETDVRIPVFVFLRPLCGAIKVNNRNSKKFCIIDQFQNYLVCLLRVAFPFWLWQFE